MDVPLGLVDGVSLVADKVTALADAYAEAIVSSLGSVPPEQLRDGISGALISFLVDVMEAA